MLNLISKYVKNYLLTEGKLDILKIKYKDLDVEEVYNKDPSTTKKYTEWMLKQLKAGHNKADLYPTIDFFNKNQAKFKEKDINKYKDLKDLENLVKDIGLNKPSGTGNRKIAKEGAVKLWENENWLLYRIDTKDACQIYGKGTRWCITMSDQNYYEQYKDENVVFYYLIRKEPQNNPGDKIAISVIRNTKNEIEEVEIFDSEDRPHANLDVIEHIEPEDELDYKTQHKILELVHSDAPKQPMSLGAKVKSKTATNEEIIEWFKKQLSHEDDRNLSNAVLFDAYIRYYVPKELLTNEFFYKNKSTDFRNIVVNNMNIEDIHLMMNDSDPQIREFVASQIGLDDLPKMITDKDEYVRFQVALNIRSNYLPLMINDPSDKIREKVLDRLINSRDDNNSKYIQLFLNDPSFVIRKRADEYLY